MQSAALVPDPVLVKASAAGLTGSDSCGSFQHSNSLIGTSVQVSANSSSGSGAL